MTFQSPPQTVIGKIFKRQLGKGKQGERIVNAIFTEDGRDLVIRHDNGTAFQDDLFDTLQGKRVKLTGIMQSFVLIVSELAEVGTKEKNSEPLTGDPPVAILESQETEIAKVG